MRSGGPGMPGSTGDSEIVRILTRTLSAGFGDPGQLHFSSINTVYEIENAGAYFLKLRPF